MSIIYVFLGGGVGSICRYLIGKVLVANPFPYGTLAANIISCLILGFLTGLHFKNGISDTNKLIFMTGFCGGFSTFSTFSVESYLLLENGQTLHAFANIFGSITVCLICIFIGIKLGNS